MKKYLIMLVIIILFTNISFAADDIGLSGDLIDLNADYSADDIYHNAMLLQKKYPEIIKVVDLGNSLDNRKIFSIIMSEKIKPTMYSKFSYVDKMHFLVESGTHGRENVGPNVIMKSIETYAKDYYDDSVIAEYNLSEILKNNVIHFVPLVNPDGYDLTTKGISSISPGFRDELRSFGDWNFSNYKSNLNGVDINRNYPGYYFDVKLGKWRDIWNMIHNEYRSFIPGEAFYFGPYAGSEIETQIMMDYLLKYDFRNYLSYHNRGEVIYWNGWMLSDQFNLRAKELSKKAEELTGYHIEDTTVTSSSSGYMSDYVPMNTLKPAITIELNDSKIKLPASPEYFLEPYNKTVLLPLSFVEIGRLTGYFKYKWYKDGIYIRDFEEKIYSDAFTKEYGGTIIESEGKPKLYSNENLNKISRLEFTKLVMSKLEYNIDDVFYEFDDCSDSDVLKARSLGIISGYNNKFRPNDYLSHEELYVIFHKSFYPDYKLQNAINVNLSNSWAIESFFVLVENDILDYSNLKMGIATLGEANKIMNDIMNENDGG